MTAPSFLKTLPPPSRADLSKMMERGALFAVVDACDVDEVPERTRAHRTDAACCIYEGTRLEDYWAIGPHLWRVDESDLEWLDERPASEGWGLFVFADCTLQALHEHLKTLLRAEMPDGGTVLFRFYDPRVMTKLLPTCDEEQAKQLLGPAQFWMIPGDDAWLRLAGRAPPVEEPATAAAARGHRAPVRDPGEPSPADVPTPVSATRSDRNQPDEPVPRWKRGTRSAPRPETSEPSTVPPPAAEPSPRTPSPDRVPRWKTGGRQSPPRPSPSEPAEGSPPPPKPRWKTSPKSRPDSSRVPRWKKR